MPTPRQLKSWVVYIIFPLLSFALLIGSYCVVDSCRQQHRLEKYGVLTDGTAFLAEYKAAGRSSGAYYVRYLFSHNGARYRGEWQARGEWVKTTKLPATIRIQYLPDDPNTNWPPNLAPHRSLFLEILFLIFCLAAITWMGTKTIKSLRTRFRPRLPGYLTRA